MQHLRQNHVPLDVPCKKERAISLKCLERNNADKDKCQNAFANFRTCQSFWKHISLLRSRAHIKPALPPNEEREQIFQEFKATGNLPDYSCPPP